MKKQVLFSLIFALVATIWTTTVRAQTQYELWVAGTQVTSENCNDLSVIEGVSGTVVYDNNTKTLTLDNATISSAAEGDRNGSGAGIFNKLRGLNIQLVGNNTITSERFVGVWNYYASITFTGDGKLTVKGTTTSGDKAYKAGILNQGDVVVSNCTLEASGGVYGLACGGWKFDHCTVLFGEDKKPITDWVTIEPIDDYNLWIAGKKVNFANCNDLSVIEGVSGKVMYDDNTKTLTLNNASISTTIEDDRYGRGSGIFNQIEGLVINLIGNNTITAKNGMGVWNFKDLTFTGEGKLTVTGSTTSNEKAFQRGIFNYGSITVSGCTLEAIGGVHGLLSGFWTFDHCTVRAKGGGSSEEEYAGSISWLWDSKPELNGCEIVAPAGAYWKEFQSDNKSYYYVCGADNKIVTDWVTIAPTPNAIDTPTADTIAMQGIYSLSGVRLQGELNNLPKGVYIVNGRKAVKK